MEDRTTGRGGAGSEHIHDIEALAPFAASSPDRTFEGSDSSRIAALCAPARVRGGVATRDDRAAQIGDAGGMNRNPAPNRVDLIGHKYGRLTVLRECESGRAPNGCVFRNWICECECGNTIKKRTGQLRSSKFELSCGCARVGKARTHGFGGINRPPEYDVWRAMRRRCRNDKCLDYQYYGARGIDICQRWDDFTTFLSDMGPRPSSNHSIDRINVDGWYSPENCRWATAVEQRHNQRRCMS